MLKIATKYESVPPKHFEWRFRKRKLWILCVQDQKPIHKQSNNVSEKPLLMTDFRVEKHWYSSMSETSIDNFRCIFLCFYQLKTKWKWELISCESWFVWLFILTQWIWWKTRLWVTIILLCRCENHVIARFKLSNKRQFHSQTVRCSSGSYDLSTRRLDSWQSTLSMKLSSLHSSSIGLTI